MSTHFDLAIIGTGSGNSIVDERFADRRGRDPREGHVRRHLPQRRLHPHQDVRLPRRPGPRPRRTGRALGVETRFDRVRWPEIRDRIFGRIDPISHGGRDWRADANAERHALRGARPLRRRTHPRHRHRARRSPPTRSSSRPGARPVVPDIEGLDEVGFHTSDTVMRLDDAARADADHRRRLRGRGVRARVRLVRHPGDDREPLGRGCCAPRTTRSPTRVHRARRRPLGRAARRPTVDEGRARTTAACARTSRDGSTVEADLLLVATGRRSNADGLDLDRDRGRGRRRRRGRGRRAPAHHRRRASGRSATSPTTSSSSTSSNHEARVVQHNLLHPDDLRGSAPARRRAAARCSPTRRSPASGSPSGEAVDAGRRARRGHAATTATRRTAGRWRTPPASPSCSPTRTPG